MEQIALICDTTSDLTLDEAKQHDIYMVPLQIIYEDGRHFRDLYERSTEQVIEDLPTNHITTSAPVPQDILSVVEDIKAKGYTHVIAMTLSGTLSSTYSLFNQVLSSQEDLIWHLIDSRSASRTIAHSLIQARQWINKGFNYEQVIKGLHKLMSHQEIFFSVPSLFYLHRGGRISRSAKIAGDIFGIVPLLKIDEEGKLVNFAKSRGEKKALRALLSAIDTSKVISRFIIAHGANDKAAKFLYKNIKKQYPKLPISIHGVSSTLLTHTGPGLVGLAVYYNA